MNIFHQERRHQEMVALERQLDAHKQQQLQMTSQTAAQRKHLLDELAQQQAHIDGELSAVHKQHDDDRKKLLSLLHDGQSSFIIVCAMFR